MALILQRHSWIVHKQAKIKLNSGRGESELRTKLTSTGRLPCRDKSQQDFIRLAFLAR